MFLKTKKEIFGLDIGSHSVKLVELKKSRKDFKLKTFGIKPLPKDTIIDGALMDSISLVEILKSLITETKPSTKFVALSISGHGVIVKKINVPLITEEELANTIQWETEQYLPFGIQEVYYDFRILGESTDFQGQMDVLLVAAKKDIVDDYQNAVREAGLEPLIVDVDVFSIQNAYELNETAMENKVILLANLGASFSNVNIIKNGNSLFTRDISWGGNEITEEIQKRLGITFEEAESIKCGNMQEGVNLRELNDIINSEIEKIISEMQKTIDFFYNTNPNDVIDKVVFFGGTSQLKSLVDTFKEKMGIAVEIGNPFNRISVDSSFWNRGLKNYAIQSAVAVGLALRRLGDK